MEPLSRGPVFAAGREEKKNGPQVSCYLLPYYSSESLINPCKTLEGVIAACNNPVPHNYVVVGYIFASCDGTD